MPHLPFDGNTLRLRQWRRNPERVHNPKLAKFEYDPDVESGGLTIDTSDGPVDLVAVERVMRGFPTPVTIADMEQVYRLLPIGQAPIPLVDIERIAIGLGVKPDAVERKIERIKVRMLHGDR